MKISRDPGSLLLLRFEQPARHSGQCLLRPLTLCDVLHQSEDQGRPFATPQDRDVEASPDLCAVPFHITFFKRVSINSAHAEFLKKCPIVLGIFRMPELSSTHAT